MDRDSLVGSLWKIAWTKPERRFVNVQRCFGVTCHSVYYDITKDDVIIVINVIGHIVCCIVPSGMCIGVHVDYFSRQGLMSPGEDVKLARVS